MSTDRWADKRITRSPGMGLLVASPVSMRDLSALSTYCSIYRTLRTESEEPMLEKLKTDFDAIVELVKKAPAPLQEMAFKMILEQWFLANGPLPTRAATPSPAGTPGPAGVPSTSGVPDVVKPFLTANAITTDILEKVFHPAGPGAQLLASSIPGNGKANKLVGLSLLLCVRQALETGAFTCTLKSLREMAVHYDCYDSANFSATLKSNKNYYNPREKGADLELSGPGRKKAGDIIKSLAAGE